MIENSIFDKFEFPKDLPLERRQPFLDGTWKRFCSILSGDASNDALAELRKLLFGQEFMRLMQSLSQPVRQELGANMCKAVSAKQVEQFCLPEMLLRHKRFNSDEWSNLGATVEDGRLHIGGYQVMADWQAPLIKAIVDKCLEECRTPKPRVLELGWGLGLAGRQLAAAASEYVVVEAHKTVADQAQEELDSIGTGQVIHSLWQDAVVSKNHFDIIFFDCFWTTQQVDASKALDCVIDHHFPLLSDEGIFSYMLDNHSSHVEKLLRGGFRDVVCFLVEGVEAPADWWNIDQGWLGFIGRK